MKGRRGASVELSLIDGNHYWCLPPCQPITQPDTWTWELGSPEAGWGQEELGSPGAISHSSLSFTLSLQSGSDLVLCLLPVEGLAAIEISARYEASSPFLGQAHISCPSLLPQALLSPSRCQVNHPVSLSLEESLKTLSRLAFLFSSTT